MNRSLRLTLSLVWSLVAIQVASAQSKPTNGAPAGKSNLFRPAPTRFPKPDVKYPPAPEGNRKDGVPRGTLTDFEW